ncbi:YbaB/EbfC family nucleoid-associated protein [Lentzea sp. PSKA42]|uniref:YbaB/EbfC family nucleoid-associated protein n=1 Tax=Lentzea indica TaxID=2604800 RepID=A0ABX1FTN7_9PSEU|nr:YbaB/EbfC family nucleoid-associated protein [Lentzea indica]NKE62097.1 YbaB/EbfC family nucleoid-associated protein [Lentzea indica]
MSNPELEARNAALRGQVDSMLANLERQTAELKQAQAEAMAKVGRATSQDGLVEVTVNAGGIVTDVKFAPAAFERSTPEKLGRSVVATIQQAALSAREQADAALAPYQEGIPDLPDLFPGMPSIKDLIPSPPPVVQPSQSQAQRHDDDEPPESFMDRRGGQW